MKKLICLFLAVMFLSGCSSFFLYPQGSFKVVSRYRVPMTYKEAEVNAETGSKSATATIAAILQVLDAVVKSDVVKEHLLTAESENTFVMDEIALEKVGDRDIVFYSETYSPSGKVLIGRCAVVLTKDDISKILEKVKSKQ